MFARLQKFMIVLIGCIIFYALFVLEQSTEQYRKVTRIIERSDGTVSSKFSEVTVQNTARISEGSPDLRILVLTFNRHKALKRLLTSLNEADYMNDNVILEIWIDKNKTDKVDNETFVEATKFNFSKGQKLVYTHSKSVGLHGQWIDTWRPDPSSKEIAVFLEDDLTVSKVFYQYLKKIHLKYSENENINGFSLHVLREKAGLVQIANTSIQDIVFLYPIFETWGFSPKQKHWSEFVQWYKDASANKTFQPLVPGLIQTEWYRIFLKQGRTNSMWSMWFIYYSWQHKHNTLYPNFGSMKGLSKNWIEPGLHFKKGNKHQDKSILVDQLDKWMEMLPEEPVKLKY